MQVVGVTVHYFCIICRYPYLRPVIVLVALRSDLSEHQAASEITNAFLRSFNEEGLSDIFGW